MHKSAFFDVDYTLYSGYCASNLTRFLTEKGYADRSLATQALQYHDDYAAGIIDYREAARRALQVNMDAVAGKTTAEVTQWLKEFIAEYNFIYPWTHELMEILREKGYEIHLISAAMDFSVKSIADILGVQHYHGSTAVIEDGVYTGKLQHILNFEENIIWNIS